MTSDLRHRLLVLCAGWISVMGSCAPPATTPRVALEGKNKPAVLFIGNSYSFGVPKAFQKLASSRGIKVDVAQSTHDGWSLARHAGDTDTLRKLRARHWDVVVLQEFSRTPSVPIKRDLWMFPAVRKLADEARSQGAVPVIYQTWGWRDGDPARSGDDFHTMNRRIREGCARAAEKSGGLQVVPVGDVWEREFAAGSGATLYMPDGRHPSPRGNELAAQTFFASFFGKSNEAEPLR